MTLRSFFIGSLLAGCALLLINGMGNYAGHRVELKKEKQRLKELAAEGLEDTGLLNDLRLNMLLSGAMALTGALGIFLYISRSTRKKDNYSVKYKTK